MVSFRRYARVGFFIPLVMLMAAIPDSAMAAGFFGPILPQSGSCHCLSDTGGILPLDWGCVLQVLQNLIEFAVSIGVILCVLWIAYAGFMLMVSGGSAEVRSQGKTRILNAVVGIMVILAAWLVVDFVMKTLYNEKSDFGPWNSILAGNGNDYCIQPHTPVAITSGSLISNITTVAPGTTSGGGNYGGTGAQCSVSNHACSVGSLQGYGLSSTQANVMSCIAITESSGNPINPPYNQIHPNSNSTACGTFQITETTWNRNASGACSSFSNCMNPACNAQVAVSLVQDHGYSDWTCPGCNNKAQGCVVKYGGS